LEQCSKAFGEEIAAIPVLPCSPCLPCSQPSRSEPAAHPSLRTNATTPRRWPPPARRRTRSSRAATTRSRRHAEFLPLAYFAIDSGYNVPGTIKPIDDKAIYEMPTSTGANRKMRRVGSLEFTLKGQPLKLTAFNELGTDPGSLFVAFSDLTNGTETYEAGRFMDLERNTTGIYEVDFNRAYIPYCYYNPTYECPYPPKENRLQIPVRAGERLKKPEVASSK
jgi:uncharacterized protein (DUF1684 family)